ncbi:MAG: exo-alpha-sialidase [Opitutus sp.]|nr:exo-alpha-sialidase [Opitutus sp.]
MFTAPLRALVVSVAAAMPILLHADNENQLPPALRGVNPDLLSGGLYAALDAAGAFGPRPTPPRARAGYADLSKGRPPAVLDARVGVNTRLGEDPAALPAGQRGQAEPHIVRSVVNPALLLATFQEGRFFDGGAVGCGYALSRDGGLTWSRALIPNLTSATGGRFNRATDPVAGVGPQGDLYLQTLASVSGAFERAAVVVSRSTDGGATWSAPAVAFEATNALVAPDKNWLAVNDYPGTPNSGRLVSTWTNYVQNAQGLFTNFPIVISISDDRGATWSTPVDITTINSHQASQPCFLPDGSLAVVYVRFNDPNNVNRFVIECKRSTDGGRTFPTNASIVVATVDGWDDPDLRDGVFLPSATVSRQTGEIFVTYTAIMNGSPRVLVTKSTNRGTTWSTPIIASDQPAGVSVMNPAIAVTPDGRSVSVVFMDKRNAPDGHNFVDHYAAQSFDGGATWQPNLRLTEMSSDIRYGPLTSRGVMLSDYMGIAPSLAPDQPCVAIWCDLRTGDADPFVVRFVPQPNESFDTWRIARFQPEDFGGKGLFGSDPDNDGEANIFEYLFGTNPVVAESGEAFVTQRATGTTRSFAWPQRARTLTPNEAVPTLLLSSRGESVAPTSGGIAPNVTLPSGLIWRTTEAPATTAITLSLGITASEDQLTGRSFPPLSVTSASAAFNTDARLINLSTRGRSGPGTSQLIVGFVVDGPKTILVRAAGPALGSLGVTGVLSDPRLALTALTSDLAVNNDNWQQGTATAALFARVGAFPFAANSLDAALLLQAGAQSYTASVSGANNTSGIALVEAYDADAIPGAPGNPRLVNLSTRGGVGTGLDVLVAGFAIVGTQPRRVLIRAVGPSLTNLGVTGALADPKLTLFQGNTALAANDDWEISRSGAAIAATAQRIGAFPLDAASRDAALLITFAPGNYTVVITGVDGTTGIALVEVYDAD